MKSQFTQILRLLLTVDRFIFIFFFLFSSHLFAAEKYGDIIEKYNIDGQEYVVTQEVTYQELWKLNPDKKNKTSIKRVFSFGKFADECSMINEKPIFFAFVKEYYFSGGWAEPRHLTIFDLDGNKLGIAPNWEYAEQFCDFY